MIRIYNTYSRKKEDFKPENKKIVKVYSCGPTVYSYQHIGNMRAMIFVDILKKVLRYFNYEVIDVINITDVGHLVSDGDDGEDKILKASKKENLDPYKIARKYEKAFVEDLKRLNIKLPKFMPRATENIKEQIELIKEIEENGCTYEIEDGVYFNVKKFKEYGNLSRQNLKEKIAGARIKENLQKKSPFDFALWKFTKGENKNHIMRWDSPWGIGFPGWHIECSAMSSKYLGDVIDIHTGGIEHISIHHENEIAQNKCSHGIRVNYWMHNDHLMVEGEKMSKSLGNIYLLRDLIGMGFNPLSFREMCLRTHYRKNMNFIKDSLKAGEINLKKINNFYEKFKILEPNNDDSLNDKIKDIFNKHLDDFEEGLKDDLNIPESLAAVHEFMNEINRQKVFSKKDISLILDFIERVDSVLSLLFKEEEIPDEIIKLAEDRKKAREAGDYNLADDLRNLISKSGYEVIDDKKLKEGYIIKKK